MPYEIITIPFKSMSKAFYADELNRFCINKKVLATKIEFFQDKKQAYWTVFIEYETILEQTGKCPEGLTEAGKLCYERLRQWRKNDNDSKI